MNKLMVVAVAAVAAVLVPAALRAEEGAEPKVPPAAEADAAELEEEEAAVFECGFDFDFLTAYVDKNAVCNDEMVMQPCVWADLTYFEPFWLGFSIWQNYDLTDRRHGTYRYGLNETDYNVHLGATVWSSDDDEYSFDLELGHEWFTYHGVRDGLRDGCPDTREIYLKATFDNPIVGVYGQCNWMYGDFGDYKQGVYYAVGFTKEVEVVESVTVGADWNVGFGDGHYLSFLYGGTASGAYYHEDEDETYDDYSASSGGFGGTTVKLYASWEITDWCSIGATIAYTGVVGGPYREAIGDQGDDYGFCEDGSGYPRDLLWGGLQLRLTY